MWGIYPPKKVSQGSPPLFSFPLNRGISKRTPSFLIVALFLTHDFTSCLRVTVFLQALKFSFDYMTSKTRRETRSKFIPPDIL